MDFIRTMFWGEIVLFWKKYIKTCLLGVKNSLSVLSPKYNLTIDIDRVGPPRLSAGSDADTVPDPGGPEREEIPVCSQK